MKSIEFTQAIILKITTTKKLNISSAKVNIQTAFKVRLFKPGLYSHCAALCLRCGYRRTGKGVCLQSSASLIPVDGTISAHVHMPTLHLHTVHIHMALLAFCIFKDVFLFLTPKETSESLASLCASDHQGKDLGRVLQHPLSRCLFVLNFSYRQWNHTLSILSVILFLSDTQMHQTSIEKMIAKSPHNREAMKSSTTKASNQCEVYASTVTLLCLSQHQP